MRRIGLLMPYAANDPQAQARNAAFLQGLQQLGWTVGHNVEIEYRWSGGNIDDTRKYAAELELRLGASVPAPVASFRRFISTQCRSQIVAQTFVVGGGVAVGDDDRAVGGDHGGTRAVLSGAGDG